MSYFPEDIPYMTDDEMEEHGINVKTERRMNTDKLWTAISGIESQLVNLKGRLIDIDEETKQSTDEAHQRGLEDAWEAARKIALGLNDGGFSTHYLKEVFGSISFQYAFKNYSASEAIEKLKAYEEQKADDGIEVGMDWVVSLNGNKEAVKGLAPWIITFEDDSWYYGIEATGRARTSLKDYVRKTGKKFNFSKVLEEMKEVHDII